MQDEKPAWGQKAWEKYDNTLPLYLHVNDLYNKTITIINTILWLPKLAFGLISFVIYLSFIFMYVLFYCLVVYDIVKEKKIKL